MLAEHIVHILPDESISYGLQVITGNIGGRNPEHYTIYLVLYNYLAVIDLDITGIQ